MPTINTNTLEIIGKIYVNRNGVRFFIKFEEITIKHPKLIIVEIKPTLKTISTKKPIFHLPMAKVAIKMAHAVGHGASEPTNPAQSERLKSMDA